MILPSHLEIFEDSDGKRIFSTDKGESFFIIIHNKNTGKTIDIALPEVSPSMSHAEIAEAFNKTLEKALENL